MVVDLKYFDEPKLEFGHGQSLLDPRDGLTLFGPLDKGKPYGIRAGVVGTPDGVKRFSRWVSELAGPIRNDEGRLAHPDFPGFEAVFGVPWSPPRQRLGKSLAASFLRSSTSAMGTSGYIAQ